MLPGSDSHHFSLSVLMSNSIDYLHPGLREQAVRLDEECAIYLENQFAAIPDESKEILGLDKPEGQRLRDFLIMSWEIRFWRGKALRLH